MANEQRLELINMNLGEVEVLTKDIKQLAMGDEGLVEVAEDLNRDISAIRGILKDLQPEKISTIMGYLNNVEESSKVVITHAHGDHNLISISEAIHSDAMAMKDYIQAW